MTKKKYSEPKVDIRKFDNTVTILTGSDNNDISTNSKPAYEEFGVL